MTCSRTSPITRLMKMEAAQIAEAMPIVRTWALFRCLVWLNRELPSFVVVRENRSERDAGREFPGFMRSAQRHHRKRNDLRHDERHDAHAENDRPHGRCWRCQLHDFSHRRQIRRRRQQRRA